MADSNSSPRLIAGVFLGVAAVLIVAIVRLGRQTPKPPEQTVSPPVLFQLRLLNQEAASPGKVVRATVDGKDLAEYTCAPDDAAVATFAAYPGDHATVDELLNLIGTVNVTDATDESGKKYPTRLRRKGNLFFVVIPKGFRRTPKVIHFVVHFASTGGDGLGAVLPVDVTKIAHPQRIVDAPSSEAAFEAEKIATARYIEDRQFLFIRSAVSTPPDELTVATPIAWSYSPPGRDGKSSYPWPVDYVDSIDAVQVRVDRFRKEVHDYSLTYRNAEIRTIGKFRFLWLPTTQGIGTVGGFPARVLQYSNDTLKHLIFRRSFGEFHIRLDPLPNGVPYPHGAILSCTGVSPSLREMGLDSLVVTVERFQLASGLTPSGTGPSASPAPSPIDRIPELVFRFRVQSERKIGSQTVTVPLRRFAKDPVLFPPPRPRPSSPPQSAFFSLPNGRLPDLDYGQNPESDGVR